MDDVLEIQIRQRIYDLVIEDPSMILVLKNKYITDELWMTCLDKEPSLFTELKDPSQILCEYIVSLDGSFLSYIIEEFGYVKITNKMIITALSNCPRAILRLPRKYRNKAIDEYAVDMDPSLLKDLDGLSKSFIGKKLTENPSYVKYVDDATPEQICSALSKDPNVALYYEIEDFTPEMKEILINNHPHMAEYLFGYPPATQTDV
jgi:hypothetical protein